MPEETPFNAEALATVLIESSRDDLRHITEQYALLLNEVSNAHMYACDRASRPSPTHAVVEAVVENITKLREDNQRLTKGINNHAQVLYQVFEKTDGIPDFTEPGKLLIDCVPDLARTYTDLLDSFDAAVQELEASENLRKRLFTNTYKLIHYLLRTGKIPEDFLQLPDVDTADGQATVNITCTPMTINYAATVITEYLEGNE